MDYLSVTQTAFFSAAFITFLLLLLLLRNNSLASYARPLLLPVGFQCLYLFTIANTYSGYNPNFQFLLLLELGRLLSWFTGLTILLHQHSPNLDWPAPVKLVAIAIITASALAFAPIVNPIFGDSRQISLSFLICSILLLIYAEQVIRNISDPKFIRLLGICLGLIFIFDSLFYGVAFFNEGANPWLWQLKAGIALLFALTVSIGAILFANSGNLHAELTLSRPVVFYSTTAIVVLLAFAVIVSAIYLLNQFGSVFSNYLFILALIWAVLVIGALLFSANARQRIEVFLNKHFFNLKFDYRIEWLQASRSLSQLDSTDSNYFRQLTGIFQYGMKTEHGCMWIKLNGKFVPMYCSNDQLHDIPVLDDSLPMFEPMLEDHWIYVPHTARHAMKKHNEHLPEWFTTHQDFWVLTPLVSNHSLIGLVMLSNPLNGNDVTFEDRDLLTNIASQVSSHILLRQQEALISSNKQMETYNRLSAFIMHDVNNVVAQLALISQNAERHRDNPAFVTDMINTVDNSVKRMRGLIQTFNPSAEGSPDKFPVSKVLKPLIKECSDRKPVPQLVINNDFQILADPTKLSLSLKNLIRNAQDATDQDSGVINVQTEQLEDTGQYCIRIADNGAGMTASFIESELFRPFATTKNNQSVGIGAYLTKSYLDYIGARLGVESEPGQGTVFEVRFRG